MDENLKKLATFVRVTFNSRLDIEPLQKLVEDELEITELVELVPLILESENVYELLNCIFMGLSQRSLSLKKKARIIEKIITNLVVETDQNQVSTKIINLILQEIDNLKLENLVRLSSVCIEVIRDAEAETRTSWKEILPRILNVIQDANRVSYAGSEMTGDEFKSELIKILCHTNISPKIALHFASMFREVDLKSSEHADIVCKLCEMFDAIETQALPLYVNELLQLCRDEHIIIVLLKLRTFFEKNLYTTNGNDSAITDETRKQIADNELDILRHIEQFAKIWRLSELVKLCKAASNSSSLLLDPFLFSILLMLSCIPAYESQISELLKALIIQVVTEEERKNESAWLSSMTNTNFDVDKLFSKTIQSRLCEHEKVLEGLVKLSFILLATSGIKSKEHSLKKIWRIGRIALVSIVKKHKSLEKIVLQNLTDRIITGCISQQYTDCLLHLCNVAPHQTVHNIQIIMRVLEFLTFMPSLVSQRIISALIPLIDLSQTLRDNLILCMRKALFSKDVEVRQTAVHGFLQLLKYLKLHQVSPLSQNTLTQTTYHGPSVFTQICMDIHTQQTYSQQVKPPVNQNINEALCLEIVNILKRCFCQQVAVKSILYKGLFSAICANPQLCTLALDVLLDHFSQYYVSDPDVLPPLHIERTFSVRNSEITVQEPIGHLLMLVQDVLSRSRVITAVLEDADDEATRCVFKFTEILNSLVNRLPQCEITHFEIYQHTNISDTSCDSMKAQEKLRQILVVCEALMAYVTNSLKADSPLEMLKKLIGLHKTYNMFLDFIKNADKSIKKKDKETTEEMFVNDGDSVIITDKSHNKRKIAKSDKGRPKKIPFKIPNTILNLKTINRLLSLFLIENIEWLSSEATEEIKNRNDLFAYSVKCTLDLICQLKVRLNEEQRTSIIFTEIVSLAKLIFLRCLSRFDEIVDFDFAAAIKSVECFSEIISLIVIHYKSKLPQFLEETLFVDASKGLPCQLMPILKVYKNLLQTAIADNDGGPENTSTADESMMLHKHLVPTVLNAMSTLIMTFPLDHERTGKVVDWLLMLAEKHYFKIAGNVKIFMKLLLTMLNRCKPELTIYDSFSLHLTHLFPSIHENTLEPADKKWCMITDESKTIILPMICSTLISHLEDIDFIIFHFKSENLIIKYLQNDEDNPITQHSVLQCRERKLCAQVMVITVIAETLISIASPTGPCLELVIKFLTKTFSVLTSVTKYFLNRSTAAEPVYQDALFHKLVKKAGSQFIRLLASDFILHVEKDYENENRKSLSHLNSQSKKQLILLPKLVSELESFPKAVLQLSKKCKDNTLMSYVKLTITRDFRLNVKKVNELMRKQSQSDNEEDEATVTNDSNMDQPVHSSTRISENPPPKRRKLVDF